MYIAMKWLSTMSVGMWLVLCCISYHGTRVTTTLAPVVHPESDCYKNKSVATEVADERRPVLLRPHNVLHCLMFCAGAAVVIVFNSKQDIISCAKRKLKTSINTNKMKKIKNKINVKNILINMNSRVLKYFITLWCISRNFTEKVIQIYNTRKVTSNYGPDSSFLQRLEDMKEEKKKLCRLLLATLHENKNIRMRCNLEYMAKTRLLRHIEDTKKALKENRCRYISFQQLYLITQQENIFLKSRIKKVVKEKETAERNLLAVITQVCHSKNNELKAFCSEFVVQTRKNMFNSDVKSEIKSFLEKSGGVSQEETNLCKTKIAEDTTVIFRDEPELHGHIGECVWTVKDKDGLIEKLYEYKLANDGDTVRRIREYSVYFDKDCLLDYTSSRSLMKRTDSAGDSIPARAAHQSCGVNAHHSRYPITSKRFLTGSEAFQTFMQHNQYFLQHHERPSILG
ncbi:uncharacterized protein LOC126967233 [Leptidea sinapis]|uniref:uncharacterized protein LOC126967233 n=1 Tax=Leptidea sinapis TaxID=189913 RepID=UPI00213D0972|nr:uncharacterized protein LOC126967233 [Leptidea sinapis]